MSKADQYWMKKALELAQQAKGAHEVPVGAVLVLDNKIVGEGYNQPISQCDPTAHAEILALRKAAKSLNNYRLLNTTLYVTLEPCLMCTGSLVYARVQRLVFGAYDPKGGAIVSTARALELSGLNHRVLFEGGVLEEETSVLLKEFFQSRR